jgi:hypothetical protein
MVNLPIILTRDNECMTKSQINDLTLFPRCIIAMPIQLQASSMDQLMDRASQPPHACMLRRASGPHTFQINNLDQTRGNPSHS